MKSGLKWIECSSSETLRDCVAVVSSLDGMNQGSDGKDGKEEKHLRSNHKLISMGLGDRLHLESEGEGGLIEAFGLGN